MRDYVVVCPTDRGRLAWFVCSEEELREYAEPMSAGSQQLVEEFISGPRFAVTLYDCNQVIVRRGE